MIDVTESARVGEDVPVKMNGNSNHDDAGVQGNGTHDHVASKESHQDIRSTNTNPKLSNGHQDGIAPKQNGCTDNSTLHVIDSRTGLEYDIPIKNNAVQAVDFKRIKATEKEGVANPYDNLHNGLRILDPGFENTAVKESKITFVYV